MTVILHDLGPGSQEATINLIDALRDYIEAVDDECSCLLFDGTITPEDAADWKRERGAYCNILTRLESYQMDPTLENLLPWKGKL
jgi:hypothetical protein